MTTRITDLAQSRVVRSVILDAQNRMSDNQIKLSTLQKSQNYSGISENSNRLVGLETSNQRIFSLTRTSILNLPTSDLLS